MEIAKDKIETKGFDKYAVEGKYLNPTRDGVVTKDYVLKKVQYIFSNYVRSVDAVKYSSRGDFDLLRLFASGKQPEDRYFPYFYGSSQGSGTSRTFNSLGTDIGGVSEENFNSADWARKALGHINWKIMSPMPKIMNKILSSFYGNSYDININCVDENSINEEDNNKWKAWVESQADYISFMQQISQTAGVPYTAPDKKIETIEELELHEASGGFKLNYAKEGEKIIKDAWNISNEEELNEKIVKDIATLNIGAYRVYYDREIGKEMFRYVDPACAGIQYSKHNDFRDSSYAYELIFVPAYKLKSYGIDVKEIPAIAQRYAGTFNNPAWEDKYSSIGGEQELACGFFATPVLNIEWIDVDVDKEVKYTTKYGQDRIRAYENGEKLSANKQYLETKIHKVFQASWVVDTDIVYEWGLKPNQPRRGKNQSLLSFHFIKGKTDQSLVEQLMPILDQYQLNYLKWQDAVASAVKAGYAYEIEALQGMKLGGGKADPMDLIKMHRITGNILYSRRSRHTSATTSKPIEALADNTLNSIQGFISGLDICARLIEDITGINPVSLGSTADPRAGKAVTEMAVSSSAAPIKNLFDKTFRLKEHASLDLLQRVQLDLRNSPTVRNRYKSVIGEFGVQTLIEAEGKGVQFGSTLVAKPSQEDIARITMFVETALQNGRNGQTGLSIPDALLITRRLSEGCNLKELELFISYSLKKSAQEQQAAAQAAAEQNIQGQQQGIALKAQVDLQNAQIDVERNNINNESKAYYQLIIDNNASTNKIKEFKAQQGIFDNPTPPIQLQAPDTGLDGKTPEQIAMEQQAQAQQQQTQPQPM